MSTEIIVPDNNTQIPVAAHGEGALERLALQIKALEPDQLSAANTDPDAAASRALGAVPAITALRARIVKECPAIDIHEIDDIENRAYALLASNVRYETSLASPAGLIALAQEATDARGVLIATVAMFVSCNLLKQEQVPAMKGGRGFQDNALDVLGLVGVLTENWSKLEGKAPVTLAQLERLQGVAENVIRLTGVRDQMPQQASELANTRLRVLTLLDRAYNQARRAVAFLRWEEGDVDTIAPSLRTHAGNGRSKQADGTAQPAQPAAGATSTASAQPATTTPANVAVQSATQPSAESAKPTAAPAIVTSVPNTPAPSGLPRSNPFGQQ